MNETIDAMRAAFPDNPPETEIDAKYRGDWLMKLPEGEAALALFRPRTTAEVAEALAICNARGTAVVAQGGLTGLAGGATPVAGALLISMERMNAIIEVDAVAHTITVEAGAPLQKVQDAADAAGLFFPLDIGSRGSCQVGGNLSTNAGGNRVLRYGMARDLTLGLEAVLADGTVVSAMNRMMKNNAAYDVKQAFIGSEGTLGIITRAVFKLFAKPRSVAVALAAFADYPALERFLSLTRSRLGGSLTAFEAMWDGFYGNAVRLTGRPAPLAVGAKVYALVEASASDDQAEAQLSALLEEAMAADMVTDAVLAQSKAQEQAIWGVRDMGGSVMQQYAPVGNFDVSVPTSSIDAFVRACSAHLAKRWPAAETNWFGHVVDGNVHLIAGGFGDADLPAFEEAVYETVGAFSGSISAEHGIGLQKREHLGLSRTPAEIALMRQMKATFDPNNILNPGKVLQPPSP